MLQHKLVRDGGGVYVGGKKEMEEEKEGERTRF